MRQAYRFYVSAAGSRRRPGRSSARRPSTWTTSGHPSPGLVGRLRTRAAVEARLRGVIVYYTSYWR
ncbi:hypothetical protein ACPA9J_24375, partial [Pseudomonas aeruginosa]